MFYLLKLEWLKLKNHRLFHIIMVSYLFLLPATAMILRIPDDLPDEFPIPGFLIFPHVWEVIGYAGNWTTFLLFGFLAVYMVSNEFSFKTFRQNIMTGISKEAFLTSKLLMFAMISIFAALYYAVITLIFGYFHTEYVKDYTYALENAELIPRYALMCFCYMSFAFMITLLVRRSGLALLIYVVYTLIIELFLRYYVHYKLFGFNKGIWMYPLNAIEDLVYPDFFAGQQINNNINLAILAPYEAIGLSLLYTTIFIGVGFLAVRRRDL